MIKATSGGEVGCGGEVGDGGFLMKFRVFLASVITVSSLTACVSAGRPTYLYTGVADDPVIFFESVFGINTYFSAKTENVKDELYCLEHAKSVAFMQDINSSFRYENATGPWKISAPADQPILIRGSMFVAGSYATRHGPYFITPGRKHRSCEEVIKIFTPKAGEEYLVRLTEGGEGGCLMDITYKDGRFVETTDALVCEQDPYSRVRRRPRAPATK